MLSQLHELVGFTSISAVRKYSPGSCRGNSRHPSVVAVGRPSGLWGLNSAFLHLKNLKERSSTVCVTEEQFCSAGGGRWCAENDICLLLTHHPSNWLHPSNRNTFHSSIFSPDYFALHIAGHAHVARTESLSANGTTYQDRVINSSLYGRRYFGRNEDRIHGYCALQLLTNGSNWYFRLWPRRANEKLQWRLIPDWDFVTNRHGASQITKLKGVGGATF